MTLDERVEEVSALLRERLGARGRDLEARLRRAGRALPRHVRDAGQVLVDASRLAENPRLARRIDERAVAAAHRDCVEHLKSIDVWDRRRRHSLDWLAANAFNLLIVGLLVVAVLVWRGFL